MNELTTGNTITVKEVAEKLNVSTDLIKKRIREIFPDKMQNGKTTYLSQKEVTIIKLRIQENSSLSTYDDRNRLSEMPQTELEQNMVVIQAMTILHQRNKSLQAEVEDMKPKAVSYDAFISTGNLHDMSKVAKMFNTGRNRLFKLLREQKVLRHDNEPYQQFVDNHYFEVKKRVIATGESKAVTKVTAKGVIFIEKLLNKAVGIKE